MWSGSTRSADDRHVLVAVRRAGTGARAAPGAAGWARDDGVDGCRRARSAAGPRAQARPVPRPAAGRAGRAPGPRTPGGRVRSPRPPARAASDDDERIGVRLRRPERVVDRAERAGPRPLELGDLRRAPRDAASRPGWASIAARCAVEVEARPTAATSRPGRRAAAPADRRRRTSCGRWRPSNSAVSSGRPRPCAEHVRARRTGRTAWTAITASTTAPYATTASSMRRDQRAVVGDEVPDVRPDDVDPLDGSVVVVRGEEPADRRQVVERRGSDRRAGRPSACPAGARSRGRSGP